MGKLKRAVKWAGALALFAGGVFGGYKIVEHPHKEVNKTEESIRLHNIGKETGVEEISKERVAFLMADYYLYNKKAIRVNTLESGTDFEMSGGLRVNSAMFENSFVKEVAKFEGENLVKINPLSDEYKDILNLRQELANSLLNHNLFAQENKPEIVDFANFVVENSSKEKSKMDGQDIGIFVYMSVLSMLPAAIHFLLVDRYMPDYSRRRKNNYEL